MRAMRQMLVGAVLVLSWSALAGSPEHAGHEGHEGWQGKAMKMDSPEARQRMEQRRRMRQVLGLTDALGLSTQDALRMDETLRKFDDRRRPLKDQVREASKTLMAASQGDNAALAQVDQATNRILDARVQLATIDKEQFQALARDLNPQQRAKLALFFARFSKGKAMFHMKGGLDGDGSEGRFRPWQMRRRQLLRQGQGQGLLEGEPAPSAVGSLAAGGDPVMMGDILVVDEER